MIIIDIFNSDFGEVDSTQEGNYEGVHFDSH